MFLVVNVQYGRTEIVFGTENKTVAEEFIENYKQRWLIVTRQQMLRNKLTILKNKIPHFKKSSFFSEKLKMVLSVDDSVYFSRNEKYIVDLKQKVEEENNNNIKLQNEFDEKIKEIENSFMKTLTSDELAIFTSNISFENFAMGTYQIVEIPSYKTCPQASILEKEPIDLYSVVGYKAIEVVREIPTHNPLSNYKEN